MAARRGGLVRRRPRASMRADPSNSLDLAARMAQGVGTPARSGRGGAAPGSSIPLPCRLDVSPWRPCGWRLSSAAAPHSFTFTAEEDLAAPHHAPGRLPLAPGVCVSPTQATNPILFFSFFPPIHSIWLKKKSFLGTAAAAGERVRIGGGPALSISHKPIHRCRRQGHVPCSVPISLVCVDLRI